MCSETSAQPASSQHQHLPFTHSSFLSNSTSRAHITATVATTINKPFHAPPGFMAQRHSTAAPSSPHPMQIGNVLMPLSPPITPEQGQLATSDLPFRTKRQVGAQLPNRSMGTKFASRCSHDNRIADFGFHRSQHQSFSCKQRSPK